jgi:hypothetical protein
MNLLVLHVVIKLVVNATIPTLATALETVSTISKQALYVMMAMHAPRVTRAVKDRARVDRLVTATTAMFAQMTAVTLLWDV